MGIQNIFANPGQTVNLNIQIQDGYGERVDAPDGYEPQVMSILFPDFTAAEGFPAAMERVEVGLYSFQFSVPFSGVSLGTFMASIRYTESFIEGVNLNINIGEDTTHNLIIGEQIKWELINIHVALPFGNSSVAPL